MLSSNGFLTSKSGYLPRELISEIFVRCLEDDELGCTPPHPQTAPLCLTHVCSLWRDIAIGTRILWTGLSLRCTASTIRNSKQLMLLWTARSHPLPFALRAFCTFNSADSILVLPVSESEYAAQFTDMLLLCSLRWRALDITVPSVSFARPIFDALARTASRLQLISISSLNLQLFDEPTPLDLTLNQTLQAIRLEMPNIRPLNLAQVELPLLSNLELHFCSSIMSCIAWVDMSQTSNALLYGLLEAESLRSTVMSFTQEVQHGVSADCSVSASSRLPALCVSLMEATRAFYWICWNSLRSTIYN